MNTYLNFYKREVFQSKALDRRSYSIEPDLPMESFDDEAKLESGDSGLGCTAGCLLYNSLIILAINSCSILIM